MQEEVKVKEEVKDEEFPKKVHHYNPKTGKLTKVTPYTLIRSKEQGEIYIRDGKMYRPNNEFIGPASRLKEVTLNGLPEAKESKPETDKEVDKKESKETWV